jgi:hypothetical protein
MAVGAGLASCGTWIVDRRTPLRWATESAWVLGFLSGVGYMGSGFDPLRGVNADGVNAWLDNYCQTHPLKDLADAAGSFIHEHPHAD